MSRAQGIQALRYWYDAGPGLLGFLKFEQVLAHYDSIQYVEPLGEIASRYPSNEVKKAMEKLSKSYSGGFPSRAAINGALLEIKTMPTLKTVVKETVQEGSQKVQNAFAFGLPIVFIGVLVVGLTLLYQKGGGKDWKIKKLSSY